MSVPNWRRTQFNIRSDFMRLLDRSAPTVCSVERTCQDLFDHGLSLSRFGDGEINLMRGRSIHFQPSNPDLSRRLLDVASSEDEGHRVALPDIFGDLRYLTPSARKYWKGWLRKNWRFAHGAFPARHTPYDNAFVSRFYMGWNDRRGALDRFRLVQRLWQGQHLLIVEGSGTRFGSGNDMLSGASSITRITCPPVDAYHHYAAIRNAAEKHCSRSLVLIALGPTASVLAHDLHLRGARAIDIGHLDVEYEWLKLAVTRKTALPEKDSEVRNQCDKVDQPVGNSQTLDEYVSQIVCTIK